MHREVIPMGKKENLQTSEHQHFLFEGIDYPATRQELIDFATDGELDADTLNLVRSLPDRDYMNRDDIWRSMAEATRVFAGNSRTGSPRDDIGKGSRHP